MNNFFKFFAISSVFFSIFLDIYLAITIINTPIVVNNSPEFLIFPSLYICKTIVTIFMFSDYFPEEDELAASFRNAATLITIFIYSIIIVRFFLLQNNSFIEKYLFS